MPIVLDNPEIKDIVDNIEEITSIDDIPQLQCVIKVAEGKYAANNITTIGPDPMIINGLAVFHNEKSANNYMLNSKTGIKGTVVVRTFDECREIVKQKAPTITALIFMDGVHVKGYFFVV